MRKKIFSFLMLSLCCLLSFAQQRVYIYLSDGQVITKEVADIDSISFTEPIRPAVVGEAVDLGLSVKWSNLNYGAESPEEVGDLVGWGDVTGLVQDKDLQYYPMLHPVWGISKSQYDIAWTKWGGQWRLPTDEEVKELVEKCTWTLVDDGEKKGYTVASANGENSIFLPVTGMREGVETTQNGAMGGYWSGSLSESDDQKAIALTFYTSEAESTPATAEQLRYMGLAIRPVYGALHNGVKVKTAAPVSIGSTSAQLPLYVYGALSDVDEVGIAYASDKAGLDVAGSNKQSTTSGFSNGSYTFTLSGLTSNATYYYVAYANYDGEVLVGDTLSFTTQNKFPVPSEPVDLGLSVKWAPWNMGASSEADYGDLIAWGDPTGESTSWDPYTFNCEYTIEDITATQYDVAHVQWGGKWRLPSQKEMEELASLTWKSYSNYQGSGVSGWTVTGNNGNSIFIPRCGFKNEDGTKYKGEQAFYWTSDCPGKDDPNRANYCSLYTGYINSGTNDKIIRMGIRPVYGDVNNTPEVDVNDPIEVDSHEAVYLGWGDIRWATCNVGASKSSDVGEYFAWGETSSKSEYSQSTYSYFVQDSGYNMSSIGDYLTGTEQDAATANWSENWRMPSREELDNLYAYSTVKWETKDGVSGYTFTSTLNGNSIFLPATGYMQGKQLNKYGAEGDYWSRTNGASRENGSGFALFFTETTTFEPGQCTTWDYGEKGMVIRPVTDVMKK